MFIKSDRIGTLLPASPLSKDSQTDTLQNVLIQTQTLTQPSNIMVLKIVSSDSHFIRMIIQNEQKVSLLQIGRAHV